MAKTRLTQSNTLKPLLIKDYCVRQVLDCVRMCWKRKINLTQSNTFTTPFSAESLVNTGKSMVLDVLESKNAFFVRKIIFSSFFNPTI